MQERYCACGRKLYVDYGPGRFMGTRVRFWSFCSAGGVTVHTCPECGTKLHINGLR